MYKFPTDSEPADHFICCFVMIFHNFINKIFKLYGWSSVAVTTHVIRTLFSSHWIRWYMSKLINKYITDCLPHQLSIANLESDIVSRFASNSSTVWQFQSVWSSVILIISHPSNCQELCEIKVLNPNLSCKSPAAAADPWWAVLEVGHPNPGGRKYSRWSYKMI